MRILLTGAAGFVGPHFAETLRRACGHSVELIATDKYASPHPILGTVHPLDVADRSGVELALKRWSPTHVVNLAGIAAPQEASGAPVLAWRVHVEGALNIARAIMERAPACALIHVGSGLAYGESANAHTVIAEQALFAPTDTYGVTKAAADLALGALSQQGLKCVRMRPFNHTGAGQSEAFVIPAFAMQIARIEQGKMPPVMRVGNLDAERDFLDVRDVADAYVRALRDSLDPGVAFNVASGIPRRIADVLDQLLALSPAKIEIEADPARSRPSDLPRVVGDARCLRERLGWSPKHGFEETLSVVLNDCRARASKMAAST